MKRSASTRRSQKAQEAAYRNWIGPMAYCVATGDVDCQLVHIRHHTGMGMKPPPWHTLPLCQALHTIQETDRRFFPSIGIAEPTKEGAHLWELYRIGDGAGWAIRLGELHDMTKPYRGLIEEMLERRAA